MKQVFYLSCMFVCFFSLSCSKNNQNTNAAAAHDCNIELPTLMTTAKGSVTYMVSLKGNGEVKKIKYLSTDSVTINSPTLPYKVTIEVAMGVGIGMTVIGGTNGGTITASYSYLPDSTNTATVESEDCGN